MGSHRLVHPHRSIEGQRISINAWRIVTILAVLATIAAALVFATGI
jgi:hypothetical protein